LLKENRPIVYIDESGFAVDSPRNRGYSHIGKRCYGSHNWHEKGRKNVIGALLGNQLIAASFYETYVNADIVLSWTNDVLLPSLPEKSVIVLDNASFHKRQDFKDSIASQQHTLLYLPPYSPDLNPIEKKWAQIKSIRRKFKLSFEELYACHFIQN
tara:strand:+ start:396 stop:863 length:468 start_codon:yes stop_codon:yes gene_type:complete